MSLINKDLNIVSQLSIIDLFNGETYMKQVWQSEDGKKVGSKQEVEKYEDELLSKEEKAFLKLKNTYWFRERNKHPINMKGTWLVKGEDPNCDLRGHHYQPNLGYYEGTLEQVMRKAVMLPGFWSWGSGGDIELVSATKL